MVVIVMVLLVSSSLFAVVVDVAACVVFAHSYYMGFTLQTVPVMVGFLLLIWIACRWLRVFVCECGCGAGE